MIGLIMIGAFLLYLVAGYFVYQLFIDIGISKKKTGVITVALMILVPFGDVIPGKIYLKYLCETEAGIDINKVVDASGYSVDDDYFTGCGLSCVDALVKWHSLGKSMFLESEVGGNKEYTFGGSPGNYRFMLVKRIDASCEEQDYIKDKFPNVYKRYKIPDGYCVESVKSDEVSPDYVISDAEWNSNYSIMYGIARVQTLVKDVRRNEIIGSNTGFAHKGGWLRRWFAGFMAVGQPDECMYQDKYGFTWTVLRSVFTAVPLTPSPTGRGLGRGDKIG